MKDESDYGKVLYMIEGQHMPMWCKVILALIGIGILSLLVVIGFQLNQVGKTGRSFGIIVILALLALCFLIYRTIIYDWEKALLVVYEKGIWSRCYLGHMGNEIYLPWNEIYKLELNEPYREMSINGIPRYKRVLVFPNDEKSMYKKMPLLGRTFYNFKRFMRDLRGKPLIISHWLLIRASERKKLFKACKEAYEVSSM